MKKLVSLLLIAGLAGSAWAGKEGDAQMKMMMAEMSKCSVCKHMAAHMDAIGPMSMEVVNLDNGVAMMHNVNDMSKLPEYRKAAAEMAAAGGEAMKFDDAQAKSALCPMCQQIRGVMMKGATMSMGETKTGDMMVLTSTDAAVQKDLTSLAAMCQMMTGAADAHSGHSH